LKMLQSHLRKKFWAKSGQREQAENLISIGKRQSQSIAERSWGVKKGKRLEGDIYWGKGNAGGKLKGDWGEVRTPVRERKEYFATSNQKKKREQALAT